MTYFTKKEYTILISGGVIGLCMAGLTESGGSLFDITYWGYIGIVVYIFAATLHECKHPDMQGGFI